MSWWADRVKKMGEYRAGAYSDEDFLSGAGGDSVLSGLLDIGGDSQLGVELGTGPAWDQNFPTQDTGMGALGVPTDEKEAVPFTAAQGAFGQSTFQRYGHGPDAGTGYNPQQIPSVFKPSNIGDMQERMQGRERQKWQQLQLKRSIEGVLHQYVKGLLG